ncbi:MAG: serine/threonine-protein kinase [Thermoplasmatota archaeon]
MRWFWLILLVASPAAAWTQPSGDMGHQAFVDLPAGPWDLQGRYSVLEPGELFNRIHGPGMVSSPHGLLGVARTADDACIGIHIFEPSAGKFSRTPLPACQGGYVQAYLPEHDLLLVCEARDAADARLVAYRGATWVEAWHVTATDVGLTGGTTGNMASACFGTAHDAGNQEIVMAWVASRHMADLNFHRITSLDAATGQVLWARTIPVTALSRQAFMPDVDTRADASPDWAPMAITLTPNGVLVTGFSLCVDAPLCEDVTEPNPTPVRFAAAWLTRSGTPVGMMWAGGDPADTFQGQAVPHGITFGTLYAAADGGAAVTLLGNELVHIDPQAPQPIRRIGIDHVQGLPDGFASYPQPIPHADGHIMTLESMVTSVAANGAIRWQYAGLGADWLPGFMTPTTAGGELLRLFAFCGDPGAVTIFEPIDCATRLVTLDADTGAVQQMLDAGLRSVAVSEPAAALPNGEPALQYWAMDWFAPTDAGFVWGGPVGDVIVFQHHSVTPTPPMTMSRLYPTPGETVELHLARADFPDATHVGLDWGQGLARVEWTRDDIILSHRFQVEGTARVAVTVQGDNETFTRLFQIHVAGEPSLGPPDRLGAPAAPKQPAPGEPVTVTLPASPGAIELLVDWGDQTRHLTPWKGQPLSLNHTYEDAGNTTASFTAVYADGTTSTRHVAFDVGGTLVTTDDPFPWLIVALLAALLILWLLLLRRPRRAWAPIGAAALALVLLWPTGMVVALATGFAATVGFATAIAGGLLMRDTRRQVVRPGTLLAGRYRVTKHIARGAEGDVWSGRDRRSGRVALKTIDFRPDDVLMAKLMQVQHPNLARIRDVIPVHDGRCLVMDHGGRPLQTPVPRHEWLDVARQCMAGIHALHEAGLIHRDIKPSNILRGKQVKITDFGIARLVEDDVTQLGMAQGTVSYMSPEQSLGQRCDATTDIYSLSAVLFEAWTGHPHAVPNPMETLAEFQLRVSRGLEANLRHIEPHGLAAWFAKGLAPRPEDRFPDIPSMQRALEAIGDVSSKTPASNDPPQ